MNFAGSHLLDAPPEQVWPLILDPTALIRLVPGCERLEQVGPGEYRGEVVLRVPAVAGTYRTLVRVGEAEPPRRCSFEGQVEGPAGTVTGTAWLELAPEADQARTRLTYAGQGLITGPLAGLNSRFVEGVVQSLIGLGLGQLNRELRRRVGGPAVAAKDQTEAPMRIVDLSVPIGAQTLSPPSVNLQLALTSYHRGPGFWQASKIEMLLHTGSHVDFSRHVQAEGETAIDVPLDRVCGPALVVDLSFAQANHPISVADLEAHALEIRPGDIVLVRTDWTEKHWGNFPTYYLQSPFCTPEAARWLVERGARAIGFDCFSEYCARLPNFTSEDFIIHKIILENGAILMQQLTNFSQLPSGRRFDFFAPFIKIDGAEGSPARFFALIKESGNGS